jgi:hypothetical protein
MSDDTHKAARGALPWQEGDEPAEAATRRIRGGGTELARVRAVAVKALEAAKVGHDRDCRLWPNSPCDCGADAHNGAIERAIAEIGATQEQATFTDGPASEDYPGELASDAPYKCDLRDGRGGWGPW